MWKSSLSFCKTVQFEFNFRIIFLKNFGIHWLRFWRLNQAEAKITILLSLDKNEQFHKITTFFNQNYHKLKNCHFEWKLYFFKTVLTEPGFFCKNNSLDLLKFFSGQRNWLIKVEQFWKTLIILWWNWPKQPILTNCQMAFFFINVNVI